MLCNGLGRYAEALTAAAAADAFDVDGFTIYAQVLPELIEAAVRAGDAERAAGALRRLAAMTEASGTDWGAGVRARSLLSPDDAAEPLYQEAIERLGRTRVRVDLGRAHLLYGKRPRLGRDPGGVGGEADRVRPRLARRLSPDQGSLIQTDR